MAYMDFRGIDSSAAASATAPGETDIDFQSAADFSPLEWTVISLARHDRISALSAPGPIGRLIALLFGGEAGQPLANPRLEALRRVAVLFWRDRDPADDELGGFLKAGFTWSHLDKLRSNIRLTGAAA